MDTGHRSTALRILAPAALIVFGIALAMIVSTASSPSDDGGTSSSAAEKQADLGSTTKSRRSTRTTSDRLPKRYYIVQSGDTLGSIAGTYSTTVDELMTLNPGIDPTAMHIGQRIRVK